MGVKTLLDFSPKDISTLSDKEECLCILSNEQETLLAFKKNESFVLFNSFEVNLENIIYKTLDEKLINIIKYKIEDGIRLIESNEFEKEKSNLKPFEIVPNE